jgi:hypothetical protein
MSCTQPGAVDFILAELLREIDIPLPLGRGSHRMMILRHRQASSHPVVAGFRQLHTRRGDLKPVRNEAKDIDLVHLEVNLGPAMSMRLNGTSHVGYIYGRPGGHGC